MKWINKIILNYLKNFILPGIVFFLIYFLFLYFSLNLSEREWEYRFVSVERKFSRTQTSLNQTFSRPSKSKKSNKIQKKYKNDAVHLKLHIVSNPYSNKIGQF